METSVEQSMGSNVGRWLQLGNLVDGLDQLHPDPTCNNYKLVNIDLSSGKV